MLLPTLAPLLYPLGFGFLLPRHQQQQHWSCCASSFSASRILYGVPICILMYCQPARRGNHQDEHNLVIATMSNIEHGRRQLYSDRLPEANQPENAVMPSLPRFVPLGRGGGWVGVVLLKLPGIGPIDLSLRSNLFISFLTKPSIDPCLLIVFSVLLMFLVYCRFPYTQVGLMTLFHGIEQKMGCSLLGLLIILSGDTNSMESLADPLSLVHQLKILHGRLYGI
jgi:hypothetical protein